MMGYGGTWYRTNTTNRKLQTNVGGKISRNEIDISLNEIKSNYNKDFDKVYTEAEIEEIRYKVRSELRAERRSFYYLVLFHLIVFVIHFWPLIKEKINYSF